MLKQILAGTAAVAAMALVMPAMAQDVDLDVQVQIDDIAELTITDPDIILHIEDMSGGSSGLDDGTNGKQAQLQLSANYRTKLIVTSNSGTFTPSSGPLTGYTFMLTELGGVGGAPFGAWPQISGPAWSGQSQFGWDGSSQAVMDSLHREDGNLAIHGGDGTGTGTGIPAGTHTINVGVAAEAPDRTDDGSLAAPGTYVGSLKVSVIAHP